MGVNQRRATTFANVASGLQKLRGQLPKGQNIDVAYVLEQMGIRLQRPEGAPELPGALASMEDSDET